MKTIAVIGDGGWGSALAIHLSAKYCVRLWSISPDYAEYLDKKRINVKFLPGIKIPRNIEITSDMACALDGAEYVILAVPSQYMRAVLKKMSMHNIKNKIFINVAKGIELKTFCRMSEVIHEQLGKNIHVSTLSGPSIAREVANKFPAALVAASGNLSIAKKVQALFVSDYLRIYASSDIIGVELGGSLKNIIAIACGICDGLGFGDNTKAALVCRGIAEMVRLGVKLGGKKDTLQGLSGMGDLIVTCISLRSRNHCFGVQIGKGKKISAILSKTEMVVEGIKTTEAVYELAKKYKIDLPITKEVYNVIYKNKAAKLAVLDLMRRKSKIE